MGSFLLVAERQRAGPIAAEFLIASLSADIRHHPAPRGSSASRCLGISTICVELAFDVELSETCRFLGLVRVTLLFCAAANDQVAMTSNVEWSGPSAAKMSLASKI